MSIKGTYKGKFTRTANHAIHRTLRGTFISQPTLQDIKLLSKKPEILQKARKHGEEEITLHSTWIKIPWHMAKMISNLESPSLKEK